MTEAKTKRIQQRDVPTLPDGKYSIGEGLILRIQGGRRRFIFRYQLAGKRREIGLGSASDITIARAKQIALRLRQEIAEGRDPLETLRKQETEKAARTFDEVFPEAVAATASVRQWKNAKHAAQWTSTLRTYASPVLGQMPIDQITRDDVLRVLQPIWTEKPETASRLRGRLERVFSYAIWCGEYTHSNPAAYKDCLDMVLPSVSAITEVKHQTAMTVEEAAEVAEKFWAKGAISHLAVLFGLLTALRAQEFVLARWEEIDLAEKTFSVPRERQKVDQGGPFRVPLSEQALAVLEKVAVADPGRTGFIFKSPTSTKTGAISLETPRVILCKNLPRPVTMHGCRSTFRDWAEETGENHRAAEKCLMHATGSAVEQAYQRSDLFDRRREILQRWADTILPMAKIA